MKNHDMKAYGESGGLELNSETGTQFHLQPLYPTKESVGQVADFDTVLPKVSSPRL